MWFMDKMEGIGATHNVGRAVRYRGPLDADLLVRSIQCVVDAHESLRTVFQEVDGQCHASVLEPMSAPLLRVASNGLPPEEALQQALQRCRDEVGKRFDLKQAPLVRFILFQLGAEDHLLFLLFHHTLTDAPSISVMLRELAVCYQNLKQGITPPLPPLPLSYYEFVERRRGRLTEERKAELFAFWQSALAEAPDHLALPLDHPRPDQPTFDAGLVTLPLEPELLRRLRERRDIEGVSVFVTLTAIFSVLLAEVCGQDDLIIGVPFVDRREPETQRIIGCLLNMLPVRVRLSASMTFRQLLQHVQAVLKDAMEHHELPFSLLVEKMTHARHASIPPVYQASIIVPREPSAGTEIPGIIQEYRRFPAGGADCDLNLYLNLGEDGEAYGTFLYNRNLFDEATVRGWAQRYSQLLDRFVGSADELLFPASGPMAITSDGVGEYNFTRCIHELFEEQVERSPESVAVMQENVVLTYAELNNMANRLAYHLRGIGVAPDSRVALCVERSPDMIVGMMAILKAGGAYVPIDPDYPPDRIAFMLDDAKPALILTQRKLARSLPETRLPILCVDNLPSAVAPESPGNPRVSDLSPHHLAYMIYTSGSTGQPKGVMVEHQSLVNYTLAARNNFGIGGGDRVLQFASINFDASAEEIFPCLVSGATLVLRTTDMIATARTFLERCVAWGITILDLPTAYWGHLTTEMERELLTFPSAVRLVIIGGESALPHWLASWRKRVGPAVRLVNTYGPTEATIVATWCDLADGNGRMPPIGKPVPHAKVYVLDESLRPVRSGVAGELFIGGAGLARGYWRRPDLTAERFIPDPFDEGGEGRLYKSGDRGRLLPGGDLEFLGRVDHQVKLRGFRIELNEIEAVLCRHPAVSAAVVVLNDDDPNDKRLVAYWVPAERDGAPDTEGLRNYLKQTLPGYMVPSVLVAMQALPLGVGGKIDREALPTPTWETMGKGKDMMPRNLTESMMVAVWCEVLGVRGVGIHDNFFDRGGHSLLGVKLITAVRETFRCELPLRSLFECPTIAQLAQRVGGESEAQSTMAHLLRIQKGNGSVPLFFVPGGGGGEREFMVYARMMRTLGANVPVYGFRVWGLDGRTQPHNSVEALASVLIREMKTVQTSGPYFLAGECLGGILAFEMARQLKKAGDEVRFLGMLDTSCPTPSFFVKAFTAKLKPRFKQCVERWFRLPWSRRLTGIPAVIGETIENLGSDLGCIRVHPCETDDVSKRQYGVKWVSYTYPRMLLRYRPKPYDGRVTLLITEKFKHLAKVPAAWEDFASGGLDIHTVPGNHQDYLRDHGAETGKILQKCMEKTKIYC